MKIKYNKKDNFYYMKVFNPYEEAYELLRGDKGGTKEQLLITAVSFLEDEGRELSKLTKLLEIKMEKIQNLTRR